MAFEELYSLLVFLCRGAAAKSAEIAAAAGSWVRLS
jgi:hypothetical protein